jgi:transcription elongation GreA/GreB family factor
MTSPIAQQLKGLKAGDSTTWQQKEIKILTVE